MKMEKSRNNSPFATFNCSEKSVASFEGIVGKKQLELLFPFADEAYNDDDGKSSLYIGRNTFSYSAQLHE